MAENNKVQKNTRTLTERGKSYIKENHDLTDEKKASFEADIKEAEYQINLLVTRKLNQPQFNALVGINYDMGGSAFSDSDLLKKVNEKASAKVIKDEIKKSLGNPVNEENAKARRKHDAMLWTKIRDQWVAGAVILIIIIVVFTVISRGRMRRRKKAKKAKT